jgi:hypothetical protein
LTHQITTDDLRSVSLIDVAALLAAGAEAAHG